MRHGKSGPPSTPVDWNGAHPRQDHVSDSLDELGFDQQDKEDHVSSMHHVVLRGLCLWLLVAPACKESSTNRNAVILTADLHGMANLQETGLETAFRC